MTKKCSGSYCPYFCNTKESEYSQEEFKGACLFGERERRCQGDICPFWWADDAVEESIKKAMADYPKNQVRRVLYKIERILPFIIYTGGLLLYFAGLYFLMLFLNTLPLAITVNSAIILIILSFFVIGWLVRR